MVRAASYFGYWDSGCLSSLVATNTIIVSLGSWVLVLYPCPLFLSVAWSLPGGGEHLGVLIQRSLYPLGAEQCWVAFSSQEATLLPRVVSFSGGKFNLCKIDGTGAIILAESGSTNRLLIEKGNWNESILYINAVTSTSRNQTVEVYSESCWTKPYIPCTWAGSGGLAYWQWRFAIVGGFF